MTLFAQVQIYRKAADLHHLVEDGGPEMGMVVREEGEEATVAGFGKDGAPFMMTGKLAEMMTNPQAPSPAAADVTSQSTTEAST